MLCTSPGKAKVLLHTCVAGQGCLADTIGPGCLADTIRPLYSNGQLSGDKCMVTLRYSLCVLCHFKEGTCFPGIKKKVIKISMSIQKCRLSYLALGPNRLVRSERTGAIAIKSREQMHIEFSK